MRSLLIGIGEYVKDPALNKITTTTATSTSSTHNCSSSHTNFTSNNETTSSCTQLSSQEQIDDESDSDFSLSSNAVVVNRATPQALAKAAYYLIIHPDVSESIGKQGRETILSYYTIERQMKQYEELYLYLHYNRDSLIY